MSRFLQRTFSGPARTGFSHRHRINPFPAIPTFIGGCNNPNELGAVKNLQATEGNITGVTYYLPVESQFEVFKAIIPDMKSVLLLLGKNNPSAVVDQAGTKAVCEKLGITYNEKLCDTREDAIAAVNEFKGKVSVIIIGNQALHIDNAENIVKAAGTTPVLSYSSKPVKAGALGGFVDDDKKLGYMLAESVVAVLKNGKAIKAVPVKVDPAPKFYVNSRTAEKLKIEIPFTIQERRRSFNSYTDVLTKNPCGTSFLRRPAATCPLLFALFVSLAEMPLFSISSHAVERFTRY